MAWVMLLLKLDVWSHCVHVISIEQAQKGDSSIIDVPLEWDFESEWHLKKFQ